jgi:hypothetical protein
MLNLKIISLKMPFFPPNMVNSTKIFAELDLFISLVPWDLFISLVSWG